MTGKKNKTYHISQDAQEQLRIIAEELSRRYGVPVSLSAALEKSAEFFFNALVTVDTKSTNNRQMEEVA